MNNKSFTIKSFSKIFTVLPEHFVASKITVAEASKTLSERHKWLLRKCAVNISHYDRTESGMRSSYGGGGDYLFEIYVNAMEWCDNCDEHYLDALQHEPSVFFFKRTVNPTFYVKSSGIESFLDKLCEWHEGAITMETEENLERVDLELAKWGEVLKNM